MKHTTATILSGFNPHDIAWSGLEVKSTKSVRPSMKQMNLSGGCMTNVVSMDEYMEALEAEIMAAEEAYEKALEAYKAAHDRLALALSKMAE